MPAVSTWKTQRCLRYKKADGCNEEDKKRISRMQKTQRGDKENGINAVLKSNKNLQGTKK